MEQSREPRQGHEEADPFRPALIVVDVQEDFCPPNGTLPVPSGRAIAPTINALLSLPFVLKLGTKDWHPRSHVSFASNHPPPHNEPFVSTARIANPADAAQTANIRLWPVHCVQETPGAEFIPEVDSEKLDGVIKKGRDERVEMYSAFSDAFGNLPLSVRGPTRDSRGGDHDDGDDDIGTMLSRAKASHVYVVGLAADYCVLWTAVDAARAGFSTVVIEEATKAVDDGEEGLGRARKKWEQSGVGVVSVHGEEVERVRRLKTA